MQIKTGTARGQPLFFSLRIFGRAPGWAVAGRAGPALVWMRVRPGGAGWVCRPAGASGRRGIRHHAAPLVRTFRPSAGGACGAPPEWWSLRLSGRGAPLPANPCSFVAGHHVSRGGWASGKLDVVLYSPQTLVPSSWGTTSLGPDGPPASWTWCSAPRKPLFLRCGAPRL